MIEYCIVLKYKDNGREEVVGRTFNKELAHANKDHYNEHEDNPNIYYLVKSVSIPKATKRRSK